MRSVAYFLIGFGIGFAIMHALTGCANIEPPRQASDAVKCYDIVVPVFVGRDKNVYYDVDVRRCHDPVLDLTWDSAKR
jgi:hypothetical protein